MSSASAAMALLAAVGTFVAHNDGFPGRFPGHDRVAMQQEAIIPSVDAGAPAPGQSNCFLKGPENWRAEDCRLTSTGGRKSLLWGDSFAASYVSGLYAINSPAWTIYDHTAPACPPLIGYHASSEPRCRSVNAHAYDLIRRREFDVVILAANWISYLRRRKITVDDIAASVSLLRRHGVTVVMVGQGPAFEFAYPDEFVLTRYGTAVEHQDLSASIDFDPGLNEMLKTRSAADLFFDPLSHLCVARNCTFREKGVYIFRDYGHLTLYGSRRMSRLLLEKMDGLR